MTTDEWKKFLENYSKELVKCDDARITHYTPKEAIESGWLGFPPATEVQIAEKEKELGFCLPSSLKSFYLTTNGWYATGFFIFNIVPVQKLAWLKVAQPDLHEIVTELEAGSLHYAGNISDPGEREHRYEQGTRVIRSMVLNSEGDAAYWLLDPGTLSHDKEWAAGTWASWNPAMEWTAESFGQLMREEFESFLKLRDNKD